MDDDFAAIGTEAGGVVEEVLDDLADAIGRAADRHARRHGLEAEAHPAALADVEAVDDLFEKPSSRTFSFSS